MSDTYRDGRVDGRTDGLVEAMRRLSAAGFHDVRCPEPTESCTCGIDSAIQQPPAGLRPVPLAGFADSPWGKAAAAFWAEGEIATDVGVDGHRSPEHRTRKPVPA